jgi:hypothetical protein
MACPRPAPNWHSAIASATLAGFRGPITVCLDAPTVRESERDFYQHLGVRIRTTTEADERTQAERTPAQRALYTAVRCLRACQGDTIQVVAEDDITFARGWMDRLQRQEHLLRNGVILGYTRHSLTDGIHEVADDWDSTLLVAWHAKLAHRAADEIGRSSLPADNALSKFWREHEIRRWTFAPSLVQHMGDDALVNPQDGRRRTPNWRPNEN